MFVQENGDVVLRIRLVVPPEKNRIIVMESLVERGSQVGVKLASRNFSIPQINEKEEAGKIAQDALTCSGEVSFTVQLYGTILFIHGYLFPSSCHIRMSKEESLIWL